MKCYFHGSCTGIASNGTKQGFLSFVIPDIGVVYRTRCSGERYECEYKALLALLEFISTNSEAFAKQVLQLQGDSAVVVYQLAGKMPVTSRTEDLYRHVMKFKNRLQFEVSWVPLSLNRAASGMPELPPLPLKFNFDFAVGKKGADGKSRSSFTRMSAKF